MLSGFNTIPGFGMSKRKKQQTFSHLQGALSSSSEVFDCTEGNFWTGSSKDDAGHWPTCEASKDKLLPKNGNKKSYMASMVQGTVHCMGIMHIANFRHQVQHIP